MCLILSKFRINRLDASCAYEPLCYTSEKAKMAKRRDYKVSINQVWCCPMHYSLIQYRTFEIAVFDCAVQFELFEKTFRAQLHLIRLKGFEDFDKMFILIFCCGKHQNTENFSLSWAFVFRLQYILLCAFRVFTSTFPRELVDFFEIK